MDLIDAGAAELTTGPFGTQLAAAEYVPSGTPVINVRNVGFGDVRTQDLEFVDEATTERLSRHLLEPGDIVFGRKGAVERHALITDRENNWLQGSDCIRLRLDPSVVVPRFVSFALRTPWHQRWMQNHCSSGATMASLNQDILGLVELPDIPIDQQRQIAGVLGAFDDLIENNRRRIEILEEMARLIYREWFLYFRFPGHEDVEFVDSDVGPVPEGWEIRSIGEVINTVGGGTPSKAKPEYWSEASINWYTPSDLTKRSAMFCFGSADQINELGLSKSSAKLFPRRTVMMTSRATIGEIAISTTEASTNQGFICCVPSERLSEYHLYFWLHENVDMFLTLAGGATFKELRKSTFRDLPIAVPPVDLERQFNDAIGPIGDLIEKLLRQSEALQEARDLVLPRLVSGELDVSELDRDLAAG